MALIHGTVSLRYLVERQCEVEHLSGVDLAIPYKVDQIRQVAANWSRTAVATDEHKEHLLFVKLDAMRHADVADRAARARGAYRLHHGFLGADAFEHRVCTDALR